MRKWRSCNFPELFGNGSGWPLSGAQVKALDFKRIHGLMRSGRDLLQRTFFFSDAHAVTNSTFPVAVDAYSRTLSGYFQYE